MSKKVITTTLMTLALASGAVVAIPVAGADTGPPPQVVGGCNMVFGPLLHSPNSNGLNNMMAGSALGEGAGNMADMLRRFSDLQFCLGG